MIEKKISLNSSIILSLYNSNYQDKLMKILSFLKITNEQIINIITNEGKNSDSNIFTKLAKLNKNPTNYYTEEWDLRRSYSKWHVIKTQLPKTINSMLDMGGNVGNTASVFRKIMKISKNNTFVVDIKEWAGIKWEPRDDITFVEYKNISSVPDNSVDLITCFHTLHHILDDEYKKILTHFFRILSKTGCIVLYEHNSLNYQWSNIIDIEHALFDVVLSKKMSYPKFIKQHYAKYLSIGKWRSLFKKYGFVDYYIKELKNKDNSFYMFFKKK